MTQKLVVIGGGPGGYAAAVKASRAGFDTTLVEEAQLGGTCLNRGCIPSKIIRQSAQLLGQIKAADAFGITLDATPGLDMARVQKRKETILNAQRTGVSKLMDHSNVRVVQGRGRLHASQQVEVILEDGELEYLDFDRLILACGTVPAALPDIPFDGERILSSDHVLELDRLPASVVIIGGGVIGCEFAFMLNEAGVKVTVVEALDRVLSIPGFDAPGSRLMERAMKKAKIKCLPRALVTEVDADDSGCRITIGPSPFCRDQKKAAREQVLEAEKTIVVVGRTPATRGLALDRAGVETDHRGFIVTDDHLATSTPGIFAIGDVGGFGKPMLAHTAVYDARIAVANAAGEQRQANYDTVPSAVFTSPEAAWVGLSQEEAEAAGIQAVSDTLLFRTMGKVQVLGELDGEARITSDAVTGRILGVQLVGAHATELIAEAGLAVQNHLTIDQLADTIHAHPTVSEIMVETAWKTQKQALHA